MPGLLFHYFKTLLQFNLPFSVFVSLVAMGFNDDFLNGFVSSFNLTLLTGGFVLALFFYEQRYKPEYYFYYNRGLSRLGLIGAAFGLHVLLAVFLYTLNLLAHA